MYKCLKLPIRQTFDHHKNKKWVANPSALLHIYSKTILRLTYPQRLLECCWFKVYKLAIREVWIWTIWKLASLPRQSLFQVVVYKLASYSYHIFLKIPNISFLDRRTIWNRSKNNFIELQCIFRSVTGKNQLLFTCVPLCALRFLPYVRPFLRSYSLSFTNIR